MLSHFYGRVITLLARTRHQQYLRNIAYSGDANDLALKRGSSNTRPFVVLSARALPMRRLRRCMRTPLLSASNSRSGGGVAPSRQLRDGGMLVKDRPSRATQLLIEVPLSRSEFVMVMDDDPFPEDHDQARSPRA